MENQQMVQLLSQRLNLSPEESQALQEGDFYRVAAGRFADDPMMMALLNMMRDRQKPAEELEPEGRRRDASRPEDVVDLQEALQAARKMLRYLEQVLGACRCWGQDGSCPRCDGQGAPGLRASTHPQIYLAWVKRGLEELGYRIAPLATTAVANDHHVKKED